MMNQSMLDRSNILARHVCCGKRSRAELGELETAKAPTCSRNQRRRRHVSWAEKNEVHVLNDNHELFKEYKDEDIWYTVRSGFWGETHSTIFAVARFSL